MSNIALLKTNVRNVEQAIDDLLLAIKVDEDADVKACTQHATYHFEEALGRIGMARRCIDAEWRKLETARQKEIDS